MAMRSKETLFNSAIFNTGNRPGDQTGLWEAMEANYDEIVRAAFEDAGPSLPFGRKREVLTSRADGDFGYDDAFKFKAEVLHIFDVFLNDVSAADLWEPWEIDLSTSQLMINASARTVAIEYVRVGQEHTWSANFAQGIQRELEAVIKEVEEEPEEAELKSAQAAAKLLKASVKGSKNRSKRPVFNRGGGRIRRARSAPYGRR